MPKGIKGFIKGNTEASIIWKGKKRPDISKAMKNKNPNPYWDNGKISKLRRIIRKIKKNHCEYCKFIAIHSVQLDVDHKDGNKMNNKKDNLQTLCSNCHRLKTYQEHNFSHSFFKIKYNRLVKIKKYKKELLKDKN